jgi:hypothetical protein
MFERAGCSAPGCHGTSLSIGGLLAFMPTAAAAYEDLLERRSERGPDLLVRPFLPDASVLVLHAETTLLDNAILTAPQVAVVRDWVAEGASWSKLHPRGEGGGPFDAGTPPATCAIGDLRGLTPQLPEACMPRCARATWNAVIACRTAADPATCQAAAIGADSTAPATIDLVTDALGLDCAACLDWQTNACAAQVCPAQTLAANRCATFRAGSGCAAENNAWGACLNGALVAFGSCRALAEARCVAP